MIREDVLQALKDCNKKGILYRGQVYRIYEFNTEGLDSVRLKKEELKDSQLAFAAIKWSEIKKRRVETLPYACRITEYDGEKIFVIQHIDNDNVFVDVIGKKEIIEKIKKLKERKNPFLNKTDKELFKIHEEMTEMKRMWVNPNFFEGRIAHENEEAESFRTTMDDFEDIQYEILDSEKNIQLVHNNARKERRLEERYHFLQTKLKEHKEKVDYSLIKNWPKIKEREKEIIKTLERVSGNHLMKNVKKISNLYRFYDPETQSWTPLYSYKEIWLFWRLIQIESIEKALKEIEEEKVWEWD